MEKFYIITNKEFQQEISNYKENEKKRNELIKEFFSKNGISGTGYYIGGTGFVGVPFDDIHKDGINLYIDDLDENVSKFGKQLLKQEFFENHSMRRFRKSSAILKDFQNMCVEKEIVINNHVPRIGMYFKELRFGGYSRTLFSHGGVFYLKIESSNHETITPLFDGFDEINGSDFYKAWEEVEKEK